MQIQVRDERTGDIAAVRNLHELAFGQSQEADIVDELRRKGAVMLSLVAIAHGKIVGHIMYSPATIDETIEGAALSPLIEGAALGPMAVLPQYQRKGIGSMLVEAGNARLEASRCPYIIVLGHAAFYPRFGFQPAKGRGITCQWEVPDDAFMLLVLDEARMAGVSGLARYRQEFSSVS